MFGITNHKLFKMKKLLLLLLISTISINAQQGLFVFHPVNVDDSKLSEFETIQLKYGKQLAQDNVDNGNFETLERGGCRPPAPPWLQIP